MPTYITNVKRRKKKRLNLSNTYLYFRTNLTLTKYKISTEIAYMITPIPVHIFSVATFSSATFFLLFYWVSRFASFHFWYFPIFFPRCPPGQKKSHSLIRCEEETVSFCWWTITKGHKNMLHLFSVFGNCLFCHCSQGKKFLLSLHNTDKRDFYLFFSNILYKVYCRIFCTFI